MAIGDTKQLRNVNGIVEAQKLLDEGWVILAVCVMQDGTSQYAEYHLGHAAEVSVGVKVEQTNSERTTAALTDDAGHRLDRAAEVNMVVKVEKIRSKGIAAAILGKE
ncbi:hypothetical protein HBN65_20995 [Pseudomonas lundensis]|uniref:hypothetical protein n=1 Tax=Pseudomonas lundensis TaxID=86185 RepID=UPI001475E7A1|nr:hypothetical protein [Pseudomonas lundensis]NNA09250.1 hypothetical protein [Pseudomonas lundensis]